MAASLVSWFTSVSMISSYITFIFVKWTLCGFPLYLRDLFKQKRRLRKSSHREMSIVGGYFWKRSYSFTFHESILICWCSRANLFFSSFWKVNVFLQTTWISSFSLILKFTRIKLKLILICGGKVVWKNVTCCCIISQQGNCPIKGLNKSGLRYLTYQLL